MSQTDYDSVNEQLDEYRVGARTDSAALLAWFLRAVWRLDVEDVDDAVCDGGGDKGIDALVVNDDLREIVVFQCKHHKAAAGKQGDKDIKNLFGAVAYFKTPQAVDGLMASSPNNELRRLILRQDIRERVVAGSHVTRMVFVTDGTLDPAGRDYVAAISGQDPELEAWDQPKLAVIARRTQAPDLRPVDVKLKAIAPPTQAMLDNSKLAVGLIPARELVSKLPDIDNMLLFDRNVRLSEGHTRVNRELAATVKDRSEHVFFPAYHNGITMLTHGLSVRGATLSLHHVTVVNGCQSLVTLHENQASLSDDLQLLVKVVEVPEQSGLIEMITYRSNNQNPVDIRDQRSTDVVQRDLQRAVHEAFGSAFAYEIREGETLKAAQVLDNQEAAQLLMAVYKHEPWSAVRKVRLFETDNYRKIFDREVTAARLYLLRQVADLVLSKRGDLRDDLAASFASVRFTLAYLLAQVAAESNDGQELFEKPDRWLPDKVTEVKASLGMLLGEIVDSVNFFIGEEETDSRKTGGDFDPKVTFKSHSGVQRFENAVLRDYRRLVKRDPHYIFDVAPVR
jgi:hypothetical protein